MPPPTITLTFPAPIRYCAKLILCTQWRPSSGTHGRAPNRFRRSRRFSRSWKVQHSCALMTYIGVFLKRTTLHEHSLTFPGRGKHGNEAFRYHGTSRQCSLGSNGQTKLCNSTSCSACSILRTSFSVSLANPGGACVSHCISCK
jgi:hypothetical protein